MVKPFSDMLHRKFFTTWIGRSLNHLFGTVELLLMRQYKSKEALKMINYLRSEEGFLFKPSEIFHIYSIARAATKLPGDFAEVGVYNGTSAKAMCLVKGDKSLYLFDTFSGLPTVGEMDPRFHSNMFVSSFDKVKARLSSYPNVFIYPGVFPETSQPIEDKKFSFVHLDVDVYAGTKASLEFFYQRMVKGGIILTHDYAQAEGVHKAFDEFMSDKPEGIVELSLSQALIVKV